jgi:excisionase family DNA binding protein
MTEAKKPAQLISLTEAAKRIGCSRSHVYNLVAAGKLRRHNIALTGSKLRVEEQDVEKFIRESEDPVPHLGGVA